MKIAIYTDGQGRYTLCIDHGKSLTRLGARLHPMLLVQSVTLDRRAQEDLRKELAAPAADPPSAQSAAPSSSAEGGNGIAPAAGQWTEGGTGSWGPEAPAAGEGA